jgi:sodium-dependent dicarboxylate transporter 2/3/5
VRGKAWVLPGLGVLLFLLFLFLPPVEPLTPIGMKAIGVFIFTIIWWSTVGMGISSILAVILIILTGIMSYKDAFFNSFGYWLPIFVLGVNGMSHALNVHGYSRRFALWFISRPFVAGHPWRLVTMFLISCTIVGSVMSGAATTLIFLAIAEPMLEAMGYKKGDKFASTFMMGIAWVATVSLSVTPIGHAGNILAIEWIMRDFGYNISFLQWMAFGVPMGILTLAGLLLIFRYIVKPDVSRLKATGDEYIREEIRKLGPMKPEEKISLAVFGAAVFVWIIPSIISPVLPQVSSYLDTIGIATTAMLGACLLRLIHVNGKPIISFRAWMRDGVEWDTYMLLAAIGILSAVIENPKTGIVAYLTGVSTPVANILPVYGFIAFAMVWVILQTNVMSNTVAFTTVYAILIPVALVTGKAYGPALGITLACAANYAFALPSATTSTAMVTGSGWVPVPFMAKYGISLVIPVIIIFTVIGYPLAALLFR